MRDIEGGNTLFGRRVPRILRERLEHGAIGAEQAAQHRAGVVNRLRICITGLQPETGTCGILAEARLQRVVATSPSALGCSG